jgi:hypothetical protein
MQKGAPLDIRGLESGALLGPKAQERIYKWIISLWLVYRDLGYTSKKGKNVHNVSHIRIIKFMF